VLTDVFLHACAADVAAHARVLAPPAHTILAVMTVGAARTTRPPMRASAVAETRSLHLSLRIVAERCSCNVHVLYSEYHRFDNH
jgi:hypothetical protein